MANHDKTLDRANAGLHCLSEMAANGWTSRYEIDASLINDANLTTDGDTVTVKVANIPSGSAIKAACLNVTKAFATDGTLTASVGSSSSAAALIAAQDVKTAGVKAPVAGFAPATAAGATVTDVVVKFASQANTGAPADITAGKLVLLLQIVSVL